MARVGIGGFEPTETGFRIGRCFHRSSETANEIGTALSWFQAVDPTNHHSNLVRVHRFVRKHRDVAPNAGAAFEDTFDAGVQGARLVAVTFGYLQQRWADDFLLGGMAIETIALFHQGEPRFDIL